MFPVLRVKPQDYAREKRNCVPCWMHWNDTVAAESHDQNPEQIIIIKKTSPRLFVLATAATSECCCYWVFRSRQPSATCDRAAAGSGSAALSQRQGKEQGRNPGVTFLSQPSWNKGSGCLSAIPLFSSPPLPLVLLYLSHCVQDTAAYTLVTDVLAREEAGLISSTCLDK